MAKQTIGVLVLAYGTPNKPEEILPYYTDIRRGHAPSPEQLAELTGRYEAIGGGSRLNQISAAQAARLASVLQSGADDIEWKVYQANRHWEPWIKDVVRQMWQDGIRKAVTIVMAPQGSKMSSGAYFERLDAANADLPEPIAFEYVFDWHLEPAYIQAEVNAVKDALAKFENPDDVLVLFTCHALPQRILSWGDPYVDHLKDIGHAVAEKLGLKQYDFAFQSAGRTAEPWLGPDINDLAPELAAKGVKNLVVASVGFISDHLEVVYDLDIEMRQTTKELGIHFERIAMLNDSPLLAEALASAVRRAALGGE